MNRKTKTIMAFLTAMTMTAGAMSVTAYAEEANTAVVAETSNKLVYEVDDPAYKAEIDDLYDYVPLENLVLKCLNMLEDDPTLHREPREERWYYKHVYTDDPNFEISVHNPSDDATIKGITAESLSLTAEQGRADDIEARDGKVRKFNTIDIYWSILVADRVLDIDELNTFLADNGFKSHIVDTVGSGLQFALHFDEAFTTEDVIKTLTALNEKFGIIPGAVASEKGTYDLYYDSAYVGAMKDKTWTVVKNDEPIDYNDGTWIVPVPLKSNDCVLSEGVNYHYNPETGVMLLDGDGVLTNKDVTDIWASEFERGCTLIIGKNVKFLPDDFTDAYGNEIHREFNTEIFNLTSEFMHKTYVYSGSEAETEYNRLMNWFETVYRERTGLDEVDAQNSIRVLDSSVDAYDILNGKVDISEIEGNDKDSEPTAVNPKAENTVITTAEATLKGDADVNNEVNLADLTTVAKYNLSNSSYPLANDTAYANADMNSDGKVDGLDTSALIESQLGKK